jgi:hypothetical protein
LVFFIFYFVFFCALKLDHNRINLKIMKEPVKESWEASLERQIFSKKGQEIEKSVEQFGAESPTWGWVGVGR